MRLPSPPCSLAALSAPAAVGLSPRASSGKNTSVYVSGLPRDVSEAELAEEAAARERKFGEESTYARDWRVRK